MKTSSPKLMPIDALIVFIAHSSGSIEASDAVDASILAEAKAMIAKLYFRIRAGKPALSR